MPKSLQRRRRATWILAALALSAGAALGGPPAHAKSLEALQPKLREEVVERGRAYFDPDSPDMWLARKSFREALDKVVAAGENPLKDLDLLRELVYQSRGFETDFANKKWQEDNSVTGFSTSGPYNTLLSEGSRFTYVLPSTYPKTMARKKAEVRKPPFPLLFVLHEAVDDKGGGSKAGEEVLKRWWPKDAFGSVYESWLMLAPFATRGKFVEEDGTVRKPLTTDQFALFWRRYHVDFDRVVLDGADAALAMAAAQPVFFAGLILRGGKVDPAVVKNFARLPVYVAGDPKLKDQLAEAGHTAVTAGPASGVAAWLANLRRAPLTEFTWTLAKPDQLLAHWVSIDTPDPTSGDKTLSVKVDKNKVSIEAKGIQDLSVFLNDSIVNLDEEVEIVVNGHTEKKERFERNFDQLFDREPIRIRRSLYLGWLFPVAVAKLAVRPPEGKTGAAPTNGGAPATPPASATVDAETEERAQKLFEKAKKAEEDADLGEAKRLYAKVLELGATTLKAQAEAKLKELETKAPGAEKPQ